MKEYNFYFKNYLMSEEKNIQAEENEGDFQEEQGITYAGDENRSITDEMEACYLDYAMSVIVSRALPDVRDGNKPVHRRILYSMYEQ